MESLLRTLLTPLRPLHSPPALRAYITTFFLSLTLSFLFFLAILSYILIYINYIPNITILKEVYLSYPPPPGVLASIPYGYGGYGGGGVVLSVPVDAMGVGGKEGRGGGGVIFPSGTVEMDVGELMPNQNYDVQVELAMPLSPLNRDIGNFMVEVDFYSAPLPPPPPRKADTIFPYPPSQQQQPQPNLLHQSSRPAILPYTPPLPSLLSTLLRTPFFLTRLTSESETLTIPILSRASFPTRAETPKTVKVTLKAQRIQTYSVRVRFKARLGGLRNLMYNYRLTAAAMFIGVFWGIEVLCALVVWWVLIAGRGRLGELGVGAGAGVAKVVKEEEREEEEEESVERGPGGVPIPARPSTPGARPRTPGAGVGAGGRNGRGYLPSPSPTPQPQFQSEFLIPGPVREGYADNEETETEASILDGEEGNIPRPRIGAMVEDDMASATEESEEEAVLVGGRVSAAVRGDSGVGSSLYESSAGAATGREERRGTGAGAGAGASESGGGPVRRR